jgi:hypothetical protein
MHRSGAQEVFMNGSIFRARSAEAIDYIPREFMCPLSLDWFLDPVTVASGQSYSRQNILEYMNNHSQLDPVTRMDLTDTPMYDNVALRNVVEYFRMQYQRYRRHLNVER